MQGTSADGLATSRPSTRPRDVWIIVCEDFHRAVGPIPTERLAVGLAAYASEIRGCIYRPVRIALAEQGKSKPGQPSDACLRAPGFSATSVAE